jgi:membrane protein implicated in regulation of membrane protease activity
LLALTDWAIPDALGFGDAVMLPTGLSLADFELRVGLAIFAVALVLAAIACWRRQFHRPSSSKSSRR